MPHSKGPGSFTELFAQHQRPKLTIKKAMICQCSITFSPLPMVSSDRASSSVVAQAHICAVDDCLAIY